MNNSIAKTPCCWCQQGDVTTAEWESFSSSCWLFPALPLLHDLGEPTSLSPCISCSIGNMGITILISLFTFPWHSWRTSGRGKLAITQLWSYGCLSWDAAWMRHAIAPLCLHPLLEMRCAWSSLGSGLWHLPGDSRVVSVVVGFCCRVTRTFGEIYDKDTSFSLLPAVLPTPWV